MDEQSKKIRRILRTPSIFSWARIVRPRTDDTCLQLRRLAEGENKRSLRPAYRLCREMALREKSYEDALAKAESFEGFAHDSSVELVDGLHRYLIENQIEVLDGFKDRLFSFPIGMGPSGRMLTDPPIRISLRYFVAHKNIGTVCGVRLSSSRFTFELKLESHISHMLQLHFLFPLRLI